MSSVLAMVAYGMDPGFLQACDQTLELVLRGCRFITPSFMGIALLYTVGRGFVSSNSLQMDWGPILKATWIFLLLFFYKSLLDTLGMGIAAFTELFASDQSAAAALVKLTTPQTAAAAAGRDSISMGDVVAEASSMIATISDTLTSFTFSGIMTRLFTGTTVLIVRTVMEFFQQFILGFLYICGPIALSLSVIPAFGQLAMKWFHNFLAVQFWGLSFVLLDTLYYYFARTQTSEYGILGGLVPGSQQSAADAKFMIMSVCFVLLYIMVPKLTSFIIGASGAQGFVGQMAGMIAAGAASAATVAAPGVAGGGVAGVIGRALGNGPGTGGGGSSASSAEATPISVGASASKNLDTVASSNASTLR